MQTTEKEILLQEFEKIARVIAPPSLSLREVQGIFKQWLSVNLTVLMQRRGYNKKKIAILNRENVVLNIGCLGDEQEEYINADLVRIYGQWGIESAFRFISGKSKVKYDLLLNLTVYDENLFEVADSIILSHVLEHIHPLSATTALKNCLSYLKPGGCIRVAVPYLEAYNNSKVPEGQEVNNRMLSKNRLIYGWGHRFMYDPELLALVMEESGFTQVKAASFQEGLLGETDVEQYRDESIYVTGVKPEV
ncbi:methyltransferase domain-containing protein [Anabaena sphaerica FACHB-251]|uniref:Methyltransferase domain-containing protein n=1 Tax=Anabaena sphaerica FACHB-251 TaxID=2692883 RepID=A0A927A1D1_9NOST|nr:methyltransferase domain-containing protein [Anabaena sphaerica]MBD2293315.1 methyltransferase domain-containing protein [Anabaena sphaerica FACHB-251]